MIKHDFVVSGANITSGGPLEIFRNILKFLNEEFPQQKVSALVSDRNLFDNYNNIQYIEVKNYKKFILLKFYYEYIYFNKLSQNLNVSLWLSLNDCSPIVKADVQAVYCHNATPFYKRSLQDLFRPTRVFFQSFYYTLFYKINIKNNNYVIVQQNWLKDYFSKKYSIKPEKIIIHNQHAKHCSNNLLQPRENGGDFIFVYPTKAQPYKNIEIICEAVRMLSQDNFKCVITIDGHENTYAKSIISKYGMQKKIEFVGYLPKYNLNKLYLESDCLIFSSKLETWGLPISDYKGLNKPIVVSDLPYARETVGNYDKAKFFNPSDAKELAGAMSSILNGYVTYDKTTTLEYPNPYARSLKELFNILNSESE